MNDKTSATLQGWMDQIIDRKKPDPVAAPAAAPVEATLSGTVEQAREIVLRACGQMRDEARILHERATALEEAAAHLEFGHDLVLSLYKPARKEQHIDVREERAAAEREIVTTAENDEVVRKMDERAAARKTPGEWVCPDHGVAEMQVSSRSGRTYRLCPVDGCGEIERLPRAT